MSKHTLGIDLRVRAAHVATLCDERGEVIWSKRRFRNRHHDLVAVVDQIGDCDQLTVVMEPTRNAWVPLATHFMAIGAVVVLVPPERAADLRRYYAKHTKNDRLDSQVLARLPLLHPEGLNPIESLGPAEPLKRAVQRRVKLVEWQLACRPFSSASTPGRDDEPILRSVSAFVLSSDERQPRVGVFQRSA